MAEVRLDALLEALEFVSGGAVLSAAAYVSRSSGKIHFVSDDIEDDDGDPVDFAVPEQYAEVPSKQELGLGRELVLRFADQLRPGDRAAVAAIFARPGAYGRFKALLEDRGELKSWYEFERRAQIDALREWCGTEGFDPLEPGGEVMP